MAQSTARREAPFGSWPSPLGAELLAAATLRFGQTAIAGESVFWSESRPAEGGRTVVVACDGTGRSIDRNAAPFDVRTRVHEYGGGAFAVGADG
ncbi:MAG: S9 family peptidase, partial [Caldimonas sp.]